MDGTRAPRGGTVELATVPATGALYRRALYRAVRRPGSGAGREAGPGAGGPGAGGPGAGGPDVPTLPEFELLLRGVTVDRGHLAGYDRACGFRLTDTLPATYPHVLAFPMVMRLLTAPGFPLPVLGLVHLANRIRVDRPIGAGEPLNLSVRTVDLRPHPRGRQFDVLTTASTGGVAVWHEVSTYLYREPSAVGTLRPDPAGGDELPPPPPATARWRLTPAVGTTYARVSGDRNPIHTSRLGARLFGFPRPIAHGMWSKARCLAALEGRLPDAYTVEVGFKRPLPLPGTVAFNATPGWTFTLYDPGSGRPHLRGSVS